MNPFSEPHYKDDFESISERNKPSSVILKCGTPGSTSLPGVATNAITTTTVASITLNNSFVHKPCIRFEFESNIIVPTTTASATLTFQIFKNCINEFQSIPVGPPWTFLTPVTSGNMFSFFVCDCNTCSDECCTYTVQVTATVLAIGETGATTTVTLNSATLSAFAVDNVNEYC
jgi:hypothetical protein